mmetsp:Transcript_55825/g.167309  ORF Transcript_55825/g.167309 Transcript_55825/m.167309 type:complete len:135 (+) Transcript_55825:135-539(+)
MTRPKILVAVPLCCIFSSVDAFAAFGPARAIPTMPSGVTFSRVSTTLLRAEEAAGEERKEEEHGESIGELPDEEATDILNSPAFLRRKVDVLKSDVEAVEAEITEANKALEANKVEWGPKLDDLQREVRGVALI